MTWHRSKALPPFWKVPFHFHFKIKIKIKVQRADDFLNGLLRDNKITNAVSVMQNSCMYAMCMGEI